MAAVTSLQVRLKTLVREDPGAIAGFLFMGAFASVALYRWNLTGSLFFLLHAWRELLASGFFLARRRSVVELGLQGAVIAYLSTLMPLFYSVGVANSDYRILAISNVLFILGAFLATLATIELGMGGNMGIAAAQRGRLTQSGVYRFLRHPMYLGYAIMEFGCVVQNIESWSVFTVSLLFYSMRSQWESRSLGSGPPRITIGNSL